MSRLFFDCDSILIVFEAGPANVGLLLGSVRNLNGASSEGGYFVCEFADHSFSLAALHRDQTFAARVDRRGRWQPSCL